MNIEKLASGSYRIRIQEKGKRYSVVVPYKPKNEREAYELIKAKIDNPTSKNALMTFCEASDEYIKSKSNVLSPSTIRGYEALRKWIPDAFNKMELRSITQLEVQNVINELSDSKSPKTIRNVHGFISAVLGTFMPSLVLSTTLPQKVRKKAYIPTVEDVRLLLEHCHDTEYYVPIYLATLGLRRGEICALDISDLDGNRLTINKDMVQDKEQKYVIKENPKTDASNREIILPAELVERINAQGYIYKYNPNAIDNYLRRALPRLGIPQFSLHKLRHFFASYAHEQGFSDATIQSLGGWETDHIMKEVYRHAMEQEKARQEVSDKIASIFHGHI